MARSPTEGAAEPTESILETLHIPDVWSRNREEEARAEMLAIYEHDEKPIDVAVSEEVQLPGTTWTVGLDSEPGADVEERFAECDGRREALQRAEDWLNAYD